METKAQQLIREIYNTQCYGHDITKTLKVLKELINEIDNVGNDWSIVHLWNIADAHVFSDDD